MTRKISTFIFIGLIFTVIVWMLDKSSVVTVDWRNYHEILSVPELMLLVLVLVLFIDICVSGVALQREDSLERF